MTHSMDIKIQTANSKLIVTKFYCFQLSPNYYDLQVRSYSNWEPIIIF